MVRLDRQADIRQTTKKAERHDAKWRDVSDCGKFGSVFELGGGEVKGR